MYSSLSEILLFNKILDINKENNYNKNKIFDDIQDLDITTGASQDLKQADKLARQYIQLFGIENNNDLTKIIQNPDSPYLTLSETSKTEIDNYVNKLIKFALTKAVNILEYNINIFNNLAKDLIEKKTINLKYLNKLNVEYF